MNSFIVHISDARGIDAQSSIAVEDRMDLGRAAQVALDDLVEEYGTRLSFPIFVDIHPVAEFPGRSWMHHATVPLPPEPAQN